jgi:beta-aspartyl-peptidase (threonine type)
MRGSEPRWSLILHGGAKTIDPARFDANRRGCLSAAEAGAAVLRKGGTAIEAVESTIRALENDPVFNAGYGSVLNADGEVEMDAALMDGSTLDIGAIGAAQGIRNPIAVARMLLRERPVLLVADGARRFAAARGAEICAPEAMISTEQLASENQTSHDTVGCVVLDGFGHIAAGTSTGGLSGKAPGRVGDSPLAGSGLYADDLLGGVAFSGDGESISRTILAATVMQALGSTSAGHAADISIDRLARVGGEAGAIVLDRAGRFGVAHNSEHFAFAIASHELEQPRVALHRNEVKDILEHD